jgi:8-oxo-dGTP pyrophosphatase MutT (NUDIX family)
MTASPPVTPRLSSAVLLLRQNPSDGALEVFMVRRHIQSDFMPDVYVFPGGSVMSSDGEAEVTAGVCVPNDALAPATALGTGVRVAAIREMFEEAGVLLALQDDAPLAPDAARTARLAEWRNRLQRNETTIAEVAAAEDLVLATDALTYYAHWITPEAFPKRFTTHFFLALHSAGQEATADEIETVGGVWVQPGIALREHEADRFPLVFATVHHLYGLLSFATPDDAITTWRGRVPQTIMPRVLKRGEREIILMPDEPEPE